MSLVNLYHIRSINHKKYCLLKDVVTCISGLKFDWSTSTTLIYRLVSIQHERLKTKYSSIEPDHGLNSERKNPFPNPWVKAWTNMLHLMYDFLEVSVVIDVMWLAMFSVSPKGKAWSDYHSDSRERAWWRSDSWKCAEVQAHDVTHVSIFPAMSV